MNSFVKLYRQRLAEQGVQDDLTDLQVMREVLGPIARENPSVMQQFPDFAQQWQEIREVDAPGTLQGLANTARTAFERSKQGLQTFKTMAVPGAEVDVEDIANLERSIQERPSSVPWEDWQRTQGPEALKVFLRDPVEITSNIIISGFTGSLPSLGAGLTLGAAGAMTPLAPIAGPVGAAVGTGAGSLAVEYGNKYLDVLRSAGADLTEPESIKTVLADPEVRTRARSLAFRRGIPVAVFDAVSAGLAGKFFQGLKGATPGQVVRKGLAEGAVQGAMGGGGEIAGALSAGEPIQPGAVFEEVVGELGPAAVEVSGAGMRRQIAASRAGQPTTPVATTPAAQQLTEPTPAVAPPIPTGPRVRINREVVASVDAMADEQKLARIAELQAKPVLASDEGIELEYLLSLVTPETPVVTAPPASTPAVGTPMAPAASGIAAVPVPAAAPPPVAGEPVVGTPANVDVLPVPAPTPPAAEIFGSRAAAEMPLTPPGAPPAVNPELPFEIETPPIAPAVTNLAEPAQGQLAVQPEIVERILGPEGTEVVIAISTDPKIPGFNVILRDVNSAQMVGGKVGFPTIETAREYAATLIPSVIAQPQPPSPNAPPIQSPVEEIRRGPEAPPPPAQVAGGIPGQVQQPAGTRLVEPAPEVAPPVAPQPIPEAVAPSPVKGEFWRDGHFVYYTDGKDVYRDKIDSPSVPDATTGYLQGRWENTVANWNAFADKLNRPKVPVSEEAPPRSKTEIETALKSAGEAADRAHIESLGGIDNYLSQVKARIAMAKKAQAKGWERRVKVYEENIQRAKKLFPSTSTAEELANPKPVPPKEAAPAVAAQSDLPKPAELPPVVPSAAPPPAEAAAVANAQKPAKPLPYGSIYSDTDLSPDYRGGMTLKPEQWELAVRNYLDRPQVAIGDKKGERSLTRIAMVLQNTDGGVILAGITMPQKIAKVGGGTDQKSPIALQRMGSGTKKRVVEVGGDQPVLLRDVVEHGFKPIAIVHFSGEPVRIFQQFQNLDAFDRVYTATDKDTGTPREREEKLPVAPGAEQGVRKAAKTEQQITDEIDRLGALLQAAKTDEERTALSTQIVGLYDDLNNAKTGVIRRNQNMTGIADVGQMPELQTRIPQTETPAFKAWFGSSKVVDSDGNPKVVYHGTGRNFNTFFTTGSNDIGAHFSEGHNVPNYFATQHAKDPLIFGPDLENQGAVVPVYLSIKNPLITRDLITWDKWILANELNRLGVEDYYKAIKAIRTIEDELYRSNPDSPSIRNKAIVEHLKSLGYDGIQYLNRLEVLKEGEIEVPADRTAEIRNLADKLPADQLSDTEVKKKFPFAEMSWIAFDPTQIKSATGNFGTFDPTNSDIRFQTQPLRIRRPLASLEQMARDNASWRDWYSRFQGDLNEFFGPDADLFQTLLSITSQMQTVGGNVSVALKAYVQLKNGEPFTGYLPSVVSNLNALRVKKELGGRKINNFNRANAGDPSAIAVDRHIAQLFFGTLSPSDAQYTKAEQVIRQLAQKLAWMPQDVQAALWAANIRRNGKEPRSYDYYLRRLKSDGTLDQRLAQIRPAGPADQAAGGIGRPDLGRGAETGEGVTLRTDDVSRTSIDAVRTQQFLQVVDRLRRQGANVEIATQEFFRFGVASEIERQIGILQQRAAQATGSNKVAIEREIAARQQRFSEVGQAQGATYSPYHIALAVDDLQNASLANLITLLHEAVEAQAMGLTPMQKAALVRGVERMSADLRAKRNAAAAGTGAPIATEAGGLIDLLSESLAQQLAAEGIPDAPTLAQAVWRWIKDLYYRAAMAIQVAFGAEPSSQVAFDWFENQLRRVVSGDFDYRLADLIGRYLPEPMDEKVRRFPGRAGTPGGVSDFFDTYSQTTQQPSVLPNTEEAIAWNIAFQTMPTQTVNGEAIPNPEARARIDAAANNRLIEEMEKVRVASGSKLGWADWWKVVGTGEDPKLLVAKLGAQVPTADTAQIGGSRMTEYMNGLASLEARRLLENLQLKAVNHVATATEQLDAESQNVIDRAREVNKIEIDRRNQQKHEDALQTKLKDLVTRFVKDNQDGYELAETRGELGQAVATAENLLEGETIPEQYQTVFKSILDGKTPIFEYVRAIAKLDLALSDLTTDEIIRTIKDHAETVPTLKALSNNKPLMVALATLAKRNAGMFDEIALGWIDSAEQYRAIHEELETIRKATNEQLKAILASMNEQVKGAGLRERMKRDYINRRRRLMSARARVAEARTRVESAEMAIPHIAEAVERAEQSGSEAVSDWKPEDGAVFTEMHPAPDGTWTQAKRTLRFNADGSAMDSDALYTALKRNSTWLLAHPKKAGGALYERVKRQTQELGMLDFKQKYPAANGFKLSTFMASLTSEARDLGPGGERLAKMLQFFDQIRYVNNQEVAKNAAVWSKAWDDVRKTSGISDNGVLQQQIYDPILYYLNTEPGMDERPAIRNAIKMARSRLASPPKEGFDAAVESLLRASKTGFEYLVKVANDNGAFVEDPTLKSSLRRAVAQGWLTSMRSMDAGLVNRIVRDMQKAGWTLGYRTAIINDKKRKEVVGSTTFADLTSKETADSQALDARLQQLFTPGIIRDWLLPFINKGGSEVFRYNKEAISQLTLQNAWARADNNVMRWIDLVGQEGGLDTPAETEDGGMTDPLADFRLSMLKQINGLFGWEAKLAYENSQTRDLFDPMGPKPHVMMDARLNDKLPQEHLDFALLDAHTSQMLLAEIAFHAAFGRNGKTVVATIQEMKERADLAAGDYAALQGTTHNIRVAEAAALGWKDYKVLERLARLSDQIVRYQEKLQGFLGVSGGKLLYDETGFWMTLVNFMTGQIVDTPKTALYNILNLAQVPFATRSMGPATIRAVSDNFVATAKTGLGALLEGVNLHLFHASAYEADVAQVIGAARNLPWDTATKDIGPGGRESRAYKALVKPLNFIRFVQRKGVGLPLQADAKEFPRLALIPGLGVANSIAQIAAIGGVSGQLRMLDRMIVKGAKYFATHRDAAQDPAFRFKASDLGLGRADVGAFEWWRAKSAEFNLGSLEDIVRGAMPAIAKGGRLLTKDQVLKVATMVGSEINGDASISTMPSILVTHPSLRVIFPLLRWPFWAMHKTYENLGSVKGNRDYKTTLKGLAILAAWNLPIGLAFTFMIDWYDDEVLGKKSNLPPLGGVSAIPFVGPMTEALVADRSVPDTLKAYLVRGARAGNLGGMAADVAGQLASPTDSASGRRVADLNQRVLVFSQLKNVSDAISNAANQDWTTTWASVWSPLFRGLGGNAGLHVLDIANNVLGLDNAESRQVMRTNAQNWMRAAASELQMELRPSGSGTPTPMSVWTREMLTAAMANDRIGFNEAYSRALEAARKIVAADPTISPLDREREAEKRVLAGWRGRNPLNIFARQPTEMEVRRMIGIMDEDGAQDVREALNRFNAFSRLIAPTKIEQQQRATLRRLTTPPNPFRREFTPAY